MNLKNSEVKIKDYIKSNISNGAISISLSKMAEDTNLSTATVHRAIKKLRDNSIIRVDKSKARCKPDTIVFLGDTDDISLITSELTLQSKSVSILTEELIKRLIMKQKEIEYLKRKLQQCSC